MHCRNTLRAHGHLVTASLSKFSDSRILTCGSVDPGASMPPFRTLRGLVEF